MGAEQVSLRLRVEIVERALDWRSERGFDSGEVLPGTRASSRSTTIDGSDSSCPNRSSTTLRTLA